MELIKLTFIEKIGVQSSFIVVFVETDQNHIFKIIMNLSRGVLPETLRKGPYAVVDERCEDTTLNYVMENFAHFLDPSV